jgi:P2 family phage contractile tail tube protein
MQGIPSKINMFNVYRDGSVLVGLSDEVTLPDFEAVSESISGPGILGEIDDPAIGHFGSQEMEIPFRTFTDDLFALMVPGNSVNLTLRGSIQATSSGGGVSYVGMRVIVRGRCKSFTGGSLKQGAAMGSSLKLELTYIKIDLDGRSRVELDKLNGVYKLNGVDVLAKVRALC